MHLANAIVNLAAAPQDWLYNRWSMPNTPSSASTQRSPRDAVAALISAAEAERLDIHSVLLRHHGAVVAEGYRPPFDADTPHRMYSVTKSFTSSAVGLAVADGLLSVDDRLVDIFPEFAPERAGEHLANVRIRHLLTMSAEHPMVPGPPGTRNPLSIAAFMAEALQLAPGSRFEYSNPCSYMLAAAVQRRTGKTLVDYLRPRLLAPLGIAARNWVTSDEGVNNGGWGLHLTTGELSRFGQLYLQRGEWEGARLIPGPWIDEATRKQVDSWGNAGPDWNAGYCYQFWRNRPDGYRADGLLGQFCLVLPRHDAVLTMTAGTLTTDRILDLIWELVLPALEQGAGAGDSSVAFPPTSIGEARSPRSEELAGVTFALGEPFMLPTRFFGGQVPIVSVEVAPGDPVALILGDQRGRYRLPVGTNVWAGAVSPVSTGCAEPYKGFARWESADTLAVELVFTEGGFRLAVTFDLATRKLSVKTPANPGLEGRTIVGRPFP